VWLERTEHYLKPVLNLFWRFRVTGKHRFPRTGPAIFAPNHSCFLDPWLVSIVSPRPVRWLITRNWYDKSLFWNLYFRAHGTVPVGFSAAETIEVACGVLERGRLLGVFPEGKISHDGTLQRFHSGIARMAAASGVPVIPVGIRGAYESLPRQRVVPRPGPVAISLGEPRLFEGAPWTSSPPTRLLREFRDTLFVDVARLAGQSDPVDALTIDSSEPAKKADSVGARAS